MINIFKKKMFIQMKKLIDRMFTKHLLITNVSLEVFFLGLSDAVQQNIEKRIYAGKKYEKKRTGNMMLSGIPLGVSTHYFYTYLDYGFPKRTAKHISIKLLLEFAAGVPLCLGHFLFYGHLEGKSTQANFEEFKKNFLLICAVDWLVYAPLQAVNFFYVSPKYRVLYVCILCFAYNIFLSYILNKAQNEKLEIKFRRDGGNRLEV